MAFQFKSTKVFKLIIGLSALFISTMAAVFSITGVASLFSGHFLTVSLMMGGLEFGKVIIASFMARSWNKLNYLFRIYFITALLILIGITSGGIFGYLSDSYQKTKSQYDISSKEIEFIDNKINLFNSEKQMIDNRIDQISQSRRGQETRLDSLYSRNYLTSAKRVEEYITKSTNDINSLMLKSNALSDSISTYSNIKLEKENAISTGELGPLKYLSTIFDTDMDTIVKYFIFMLIFVFDPLAILLFVSLNVIIKNESFEESNTIVNDTTINGKQKWSKFISSLPSKEEIDDDDVIILPDNDIDLNGIKEELQEKNINEKIPDDKKNDVTPVIKKDSDVITDKIKSNEDKHNFYHGGSSQERPLDIKYRTSNIPIDVIQKIDKEVQNKQHESDIKIY